MAEWAMFGGGRYESVGADTAASRGTSVTASGSTNTKGSYTQLIASTAFDATSIRVTVGPATALTGYLVDIAVGAGGSETVIAANLPAYSRVGTAMTYDLPIGIPAGTRVAARCQSATGSAVCYVSAVLHSAPWSRHVPLSRVATYNAATSTSTVTNQLDPGGTANTLGSWVQLTASTDWLVKGITLALPNANGALSDADWLIDVGVGAAASETVLIPKIHVAASTTADFVTPAVLPMFPVEIPASTRVAVRAQCSITDASDRKLDPVLIVVG